MDNKALQNYYGTNYYKAMANMAKANNQSRAAFLNTYPHSTINRFKFTTVMNKDGSVKSSNIWFINRNKTLTDITTKAFLTDMSMTKYLTNYTQNYEGSFPIIWLTGTVHSLPKGNGHFYTRFGKRQGYYDGFPVHDVLNYPVNNFKVYVNSKDYFMSKLPELSISFPGKPFIWDDEGSYFTTIFAMYLATYCCGVSLQHLTPNDDTYPMVTSIMRFHVYFTVRRLLRRWTGDESMYAASGEFSGSKLYRQILKLPWTFSYEPFKDSHGVRGVHNINVVQSGWKTHYKRYVPTKSDGLTKIGLQYLNQSIEAYVYAILGAQAKTRVGVVNHGAGSLETQQEFRTLVKDAIVNYSISTWILNMNTAISDTHVTQDLAISPKTWLVPSKMIILKKPIVGYNNLLKTAGASSAMHFGVNNKVNYSGGVYRPVLSAVHTDHNVQQPFNVHSQSKMTPSTDAPHSKTTDDALSKLTIAPQSKTTPSTDEPQQPKSNSTIIVIGLLAGFLISRYVV